MVCDLLSKFDYYDRWVVPHQLLPFVLTLYGVDYRLVMLMVYIWETFEVFLTFCLQLFEVENVTDTIISDPVQGFLGIGAAVILLKFNGHDTILDKSFDIFNPWHILYFIILVSPSLTLITQLYEIHLHWLYPFVLCGMVVLVYKLNNKSYKNGIIIYFNIISLSTLVFAIESFNSFYIGLIWGICFIFITIIFKI